MVRSVMSRAQLYRRINCGNDDNRLEKVLANCLASVSCLGTLVANQSLLVNVL